MSSLDDVGALQARDASNMLQHVAALPEQLARAASVQVAFRERHPEFVRRVHAGVVREAVVCGMGGSAIGGDCAAVWAAAHGARVDVWRGYERPGWDTTSSVWIFSSYSGNTEETLSAFDASPRDATRLCISAGGQLEQRARADSVPHITLPSGLPPRAALGHSLVALLVALHECGLVETDPRADLDAVAHNLAQRGPRLASEVPESSNPAKQLARRWHAHLPFFYSGGTCQDAVSRRWKGQLAENAEALAFSSTLPEMNHNEIMAWSALPEVRKHALLFFLHDPHDDVRVERRMRLTGKLLEPHVGAVEHLTVEGDNVLQHMLTMTQLGDYASVYLAHLNGVDPTPVGRIEALKEHMAHGL